MIERVRKGVAWLDWGVAIGCMVAGIYLWSAWLFASGVLGMALACANPARRIEKFLLTRLAPRRRIARGAP